MAHSGRNISLGTHTFTIHRILFSMHHTHLHALTRGFIVQTKHTYKGGFTYATGLGIQSFGLN